MNEKSCVGCKFLYTEGSGYSNYTWEDTDVMCAQEKNPNLPASKPYDWKRSDDNWPTTNASRCELYATHEGDLVELDIDGEDGPADYTSDEEAIAAICQHSGRGRNGRAT